MHSMDLSAESDHKNEQEWSFRVSISNQVSAEEVDELAERDEIDAIIQIDVTGTRNPEKLLGLSRKPIRVLAKLTRVGLVTRNKEHRAR